MTSKREQILVALQTKLETLESAYVKVYRNEDKPQKVDGGLVILRDGESEEPEVMLSPLTYIYQHSAHIDIMVQNGDSAARDKQLDALLVSIGGIITANRTLGGLAEWMEASAPTFIEEPIEGAGGVKMAQLLVLVRFFTTDPLN